MIEVKSRYKYLGHDHNLVAWQVKLFDSLSENNFRMSIRIHLMIAPQSKEIKSRNNIIKTRFDEHWRYQKYWFPHHNLLKKNMGIVTNCDKQDSYTYDALICLIDSSSGKTHFCHSGEPYDIHPRMIGETFNPELPRRTKCTDLVGICKQTVKLDVPYDTFPPSGIVGAVAWMARALNLYTKKSEQEC